MYASNKLSPGPQIETARVGATARAENPTKEIIPMEEDIMDGTANVGADAAYIKDVEDSKVVTAPADGGEAVELMRVQD